MKSDVNSFYHKLHKLTALLTVGFVTVSMCGCGEEKTFQSNAPSSTITPAVKGSRDNTPVCLVPTAPGEVVYSNNYAQVDASNSSEGYVVVKYLGESPKVKLQIVGPDQVTYTYDLSSIPTDEVFPLQSGNGEYLVNVYENIEGTQYSMAFSTVVDVNLSDEFLPFLYPNQYVTFSSSSLAIAKGEELAYSCNSDLDVVSAVYNFMIQNVTYDYDEAETVQSGYLPDVDEVLTTGKGICFDYAALMTAMLRSQQIPTRMEIGYAGTAYHAWLSTYIEDVGWVNGMIEFDGTKWSLMDPTFASNMKKKSELKSFIGDGSNYSVKYIY
ncbi:transglutaminase-like domain-containing protein [Butyrivibrio proteoclasticus]|uniref:transglutaminase-like domain-containing protein n=1 Tax=Butyrivibrio proteoclasticus TaxID=43305 RepID=UPI0009DEABC4|nr:transglutaminase-like domain-containing protein [Butyrivibrio proteoclasticus]